MKRLFLLLAALSLPFLAGCDPVIEPPAGSPACTDIIGGGGFYDGSTVLFSIDLNDNPCTNVRYRLYVDDEDGGSRLAVSTYQGTSSLHRVDFAATATDVDPADQTVCVHNWTIAADGKMLDRAPDTGCLALTAGEEPPANRYK